jgi:hypothetical protein
MGLFLKLLFYSIGLHVYFCASHHAVLVTMALKYHLNSDTVIPPASHFAQDCFGSLDSFMLPYAF